MKYKVLKMKVASIQGRGDQPVTSTCFVNGSDKKIYGYGEALYHIENTYPDIALYSRSYLNVYFKKLTENDLDIVEVNEKDRVVSPETSNNPYKNIINIDSAYVLRDKPDFSKEEEIFYE